MIKFIVGGRTVSAEDFHDAAEAEILDSIRDYISQKVGSIRDPKTGEFPTIVIRGDSLHNLKMEIDASSEVISKIKSQLEIDDEDEDEDEYPDDISTEMNTMPPRAFLSYSFEDQALAKSIATKLQENGIDTWWAEWCISSGDSLRQKIEEGLGSCTHFLALLTPNSIKKPWVNQEIDAGLIMKINNNCTFIPIRNAIKPADMPLLLQNLLSPEINDGDDITQLVNDIYGVSKKPPLGKRPKSVQENTAYDAPYSPAAMSVARLFVEQSRHGMFADPQISISDISSATSLTQDDVKDALYELSGFFKDTGYNPFVKHALFANFDQYWKEWDPRVDAMKLASDIFSDKDFPRTSKKISEHYQWKPRRLNAALAYLLERNLILDTQGIGSGPFILSSIHEKEDDIRRFMKRNL